MQLSVVVNASCSEGQDMGKALQYIQGIMLPEDPDQVLHDAIRKQASIAEEQDSYFQAFFDGNSVKLVRKKKDADASG